MFETNENVIKTINRGRLDIYIPLKFETNYNYSKLCKEISECIDKDIKRHLNKGKRTLQNDFNDIKDKNDVTTYGKLKLLRKIKRWIRHQKPKKENNSMTENDGTEIELSRTERGFLIQINPGEIKTFYERHNQLLNEELKQNKQLYGTEFIESHDRFVLLPLRIQLNNDKFVWLNAILIVFRNKMGVLKLELPLIGITAQIFMDNDIDKLVKSVEDKFDVLDVQEPLSINAIYNAYLKRITNALKANIVTQGIFKNIICTDFDNMPKQINDIPDNVKQDLFKIIAAPVQIRRGTSYEKIVHDYLEEHSWGENNFKYITSSTGDCLSIVDVCTIEWLNGEWRKDSNINKLDEENIESIHRMLVRDLCINVEFAILILLLKKINVSYSYGMKIIKPKDIHRVQNLYNLNLMFIADLQMACYGTVSDQINSFENMMKHYLKNEITTQKMEAVDHILLDEENSRYALMQNFLAFGSIALTALYGLPAIYETIAFVRNACVFIVNDIPIISIQNVSISLWIISIVYFVLYTINLKKNNSKKYLKF